MKQQRRRRPESPFEYSQNRMQNVNRQSQMVMRNMQDLTLGAGTLMLGMGTIGVLSGALLKK